MVLNDFLVTLMETHCRFTTISEIFATTILKIHMSSQGKADSIEFYDCIFDCYLALDY